MCSSGRKEEGLNQARPGNILDTASNRSEDWFESDSAGSSQGEPFHLERLVMDMPTMARRLLVPIPRTLAADGASAVRMVTMRRAIPRIVYIQGRKRANKARVETQAQAGATERNQASCQHRQVRQIKSEQAMRLPIYLDDRDFPAGMFDAPIVRSAGFVSPEASQSRAARSRRRLQKKAPLPGTISPQSLAGAALPAWYTTLLCLQAGQQSRRRRQKLNGQMQSAQEHHADGERGDNQSMAARLRDLAWFQRADRYLNRRSRKSRDTVARSHSCGGHGHDCAITRGLDLNGVDLTMLHSHFTDDDE